MPVWRIGRQGFQLTERQLEAIATGGPNPEPKPSFTTRILWRVCENGVSFSATTIAAEEWQDWDDPISAEVVMWVLEELNAQGLVTYGLGDYQQFIHIRPTSRGFTAAGYPPPSTILIGSRRRYREDSARHPGDRTDFRTLDDIAWGGPIERDTLANHLIKYPDHWAIHPHIGKEIPMTTPDTSLADMTAEQIMKERGLSFGKAYELRKAATAELRSAGASSSLADEILRALKEHGVQPTVALLAEHLSVRKARDISAAVWSLQKRQLVSFYERKDGRDSILYKIGLSPQGAKEMGVEYAPRRVSKAPRPMATKANGGLKGRSPVGVDRTDYRTHGQKAQGGPIEHIAGTPEGKLAFAPGLPELVTETTMSEEEAAQHREHQRELETPRQLHQNERVIEPNRLAGFPLFEAIVNRAAAREKYETAAKTLEGIDDEMALELLSKVSFSTLEEEVLRFLRR